MAGFPERARPCLVDERIQGGCKCMGLGIADDPGDIMLDELQRTSRIGRSNYRLAGQKSLERDVPVVLVVGRIDNSPRIGIQIDERLLTDPPAELDAVRNAGISGFPA